MGVGIQTGQIYVEHKHKQWHRTSKRVAEVPILKEENQLQSERDDHNTNRRIHS